MEMIDNINRLLGDDLKESLQFVFTAPAFVPTEVTDRLKKERREFFIPKSQRESGLYGTEFKIQLRNKLTQRAVAREFAQWIRQKARFCSNNMLGYWRLSGYGSTTTKDRTRPSEKYPHPGCWRSLNPLLKITVKNKSVLILPIRRETLQDKTVFFVDDNALVACFDSGVTEGLVKEFAEHEPLRVVFHDNGFVSDAMKINVEQIFRQLSPSTEVRSL